MTDSAATSIRKTTHLEAPLARVWAAISDSAQFGAWFGAEFDGPFVAGTTVAARIRPTAVDPEVARMQAPHAGTPFVVAVERVDPERRLSFRWHPGGDSTGPMTLVEFVLETAPGGTTLTITESGFDRIPLERRAKALAGNDEGWTHQLRLVAAYLALPA
ncbi:MAG: SRPBCC family protein [Acidobacteria bacterium]|nr:SRPBCC family protein [Acidobacteriota bacterium]